MAVIFLPSLLRTAAGGADRVVVDALTLRQAIAALDRLHPGLAAYLLDDRGELRPEVAAAVDGELAPLGLLQPLQPGSEVHFIPAISGGAGAGVRALTRRTGDFYDAGVAGMRQAEARLAARGHRLTGPRKAVLEAIANASRPFSIEDICAALPGVGRATVFRSVRLFQDLEVVCRVPLEDGTARYQLSRSQEHHHHLVCTSCGAVTEFDDPVLDGRIRANAADASFRLDAHSVELYGLCGRCQEAAAPAD